MNDVFLTWPNQVEPWPTAGMWRWYAWLSPTDVSTLPEVPAHRRLMLWLWRANNPSHGLTNEEYWTLLSSQGHREQQWM